MGYANIICVLGALFGHIYNSFRAHVSAGVFTAVHDKGPLSHYSQFCVVMDALYKNYKFKCLQGWGKDALLKEERGLSVSILLEIVLLSVHDSPLGTDSDDFTRNLFL